MHEHCTPDHCDNCDHARINCLCGNYCPYNKRTRPLRTPKRRPRKVKGT